VTNGVMTAVDDGVEADGVEADGLISSQKFYLEMFRRGGQNALAVIPVRISGKLHIEALRQSFEELIFRHESFRTSIVDIDGAFHHRIAPPGRFSLSILDLSDSSEDAAAAEQRARAHIESLAARAQNVLPESLFDVQLLKLSERIHIQIVLIHHYITDGISREIMFRELWRMYASFARGEPSPLERMPLQFSYYRRWQQQAIRTWQVKHAAYWNERLAGAAPIRLGGATSGPLDPAAARARFSLDADLTLALRELASRSRMFLSLVMYTIYVATISRLSGQRDVVFTTTVNGRDRPEHRAITGYLGHPMYFRIQMGEKDTFSQLLHNVRQRYFQAILRKDFGGTVVGRLELMGRAFVQWHPWSQDEIDGVPVGEIASRLDLLVERFDVSRPTSLPEGFDHYVVFAESMDCIAGGVLYRQAAVSAETVSRMISTFKEVATTLVTDLSAQVTGTGP
jgi:hypothetical protein